MFALGAAMAAFTGQAEGAPRRHGRKPPKILAIPPPTPRPQIEAGELDERYAEPPRRDPNSRLAVVFPPPVPLPRPDGGELEERYAEPPQRDPNSRLALRFPPPAPKPRPKAPASRRMQKAPPPQQHSGRLANIFPPPAPKPRPMTNVFPPPAPAARPKEAGERFAEEAARDPNSRSLNVFPPPAPEWRPQSDEEAAEALPPPPPPPDEATINACLADLDAAGVKYARTTVTADNEWCRPGIPLTVTAIEGETPIRFSPPVLADCRLALALAKWLKETVAPAAVETMGEAPVAVSGACYECRRRYGRTGGPMSEHALANAMDVMGFVLPKDRKVNVLQDYDQETPAGLFLQKIRTEACKHFTTVLGPGTDAAHANHFHLDVKERKRNYRVCQ